MGLRGVRRSARLLAYPMAAGTPVGGCACAALLSTWGRGSREASHSPADGASRGQEGSSALLGPQLQGRGRTCSRCAPSSQHLLPCPAPQPARLGPRTQAPGEIGRSAAFREQVGGGREMLRHGERLPAGPDLKSWGGRPPGRRLGDLGQVRAGGTGQGPRPWATAGCAPGENSRPVCGIEPLRPRHRFPVLGLLLVNFWNIPCLSWGIWATWARAADWSLSSPCRMFAEPCLLVCFVPQRARLWVWSDVARGTVLHPPESLSLTLSPAVGPEWTAPAAPPWMHLQVSACRRPRRQRRRARGGHRTG